MMKKNLWKEIIAIALLSIGVIVYMFPFYWMLLESFKSYEDVMKMPPDLFITTFRFQNYAEAVKYIPFFRYLLNTTYISTLSAVGVVITSSFVAYGFSKIKWPGRETIFAISLSTMMIPFMIIMIPLYIEFKGLGIIASYKSLWWLAKILGIDERTGWIGSYKPLWVPACFATTWNIFFLRQFYRGVPDELVEAARIDGASHLRVWAKILVPLSKPALAVAFLFHFIFVWKDFLAPLIFITDQDKYTIALGLDFYKSQHGGTEWQYLMAAVTLATIPTVILFIAANKYLLQGIQIGTGLKD